MTPAGAFDTVLVQSDASVSVEPRPAGAEAPVVGWSADQQRATDAVFGNAEAGTKWLVLTLCGAAIKGWQGMRSPPGRPIPPRQRIGTPDTAS